MQPQDFQLRVCKILMVGFLGRVGHHDIISVFPGTHVSGQGKTIELADESDQVCHRGSAVA